MVGMPRFAPLLLCPALLAACGPSSEPRSLLLISLDSTRRDLLSAYGHRSPHAPERRTTPNIDRLAAQGVLF